MQLRNKLLLLLALSLLAGLLGVVHPAQSGKPLRRRNS